MRSSLDVSWVHRLNAVTQIRQKLTLITIIKAKQSEIRSNHRSDNFWTSKRYKAPVIFLGRKLVHSLFMALNKFPHHAASVQRNLLCFQRINCLGQIWDLSSMFTKPAVLFASYLMFCLFLQACNAWMDSGFVAMTVIYRGF